ncbi:DUF7529 family protein [Natronobacterium gregoryi]|uniref:Uncharacterized protein n=2 Tax=Natronobacterium gregoryi TaxID=44930 RepID=L0AHN4_NATGS|nr:hypothetical protein [Natronobacterium gregoryi]AFZ72652.1 hypothetical protein Natgr_1441 [Natronobacterium gregoryi SP2]ELY69060.1 hypothetical protein C490_08716 [Natronobacterium gregoryi SP2]PLK20604.1 hypothetical protein CYV19_08340 [Natronobacterium gregoryi SP2]SFI90746.1 hypothetical protein SAMN05443661_10933 [Natronobacterium gregoryi]
MTDTGSDHETRGRPTPGQEAVTNAWERTLEDMDALAEQREEQGWDVVTIRAGTTTPTAPSNSSDDRFGPSFIVPDDEAEQFEEAFERGGFPLYEVYRETVDDRVFLVVEYRDPDAETVIMVAGQYRLRDAAGMATAAIDEDAIYTRVRTLDGTVCGSFQHDEYEKFVPDVERVANWHDSVDGR